MEGITGTHPITLVVLLKRPQPGYSKQRLAASVGQGVAFEIANRLLQCALEDADDWDGPVVLSPSSPEDLIWAQSLMQRSATVIAQQAGNLGERINALDQQLRLEGYEQILYMGTDAPVLNVTHFRSAVQGLNEADVVLNAADDGGVVLMGSRCSWPPLAALPWSTDQLGASLNRCCIDAGLRTTYAVPGYDIDLIEDVRRLLHDLAGDNRSARHALWQFLHTLNVEPIMFAAHCADNGR